MSRIRCTKPEQWVDEQFTELSHSARLLKIGMQNFCDDGGVHPDSPKRLMLEVFPGDGLKVDQVAAWLDELIDVGLVVRFEAEGNSWLWVTDWHNQKIDRPTCKYPQPKFDDHSASHRRSVGDNSARPRRSVDEGSPSPSPWIGRELESDGIDSGMERISIDQGATDRPDATPIEPLTVDAELWNRLVPQLKAAEKLLAGSNLQHLTARDRKSSALCIIAGDRFLPPGEFDAINARIRENLASGKVRHPFKYQRKAFVQAFQAHGLKLHDAERLITIPAQLIDVRPPPDHERSGTERLLPREEPSGRVAEHSCGT